MAKVAASREAFLPLFVGDFLGATAEWSGEEQALYLLALAYQWSIGSLPADRVKLCRLFRWERRAFDRAWPQVAEKFTESDGRLANARLEQHREKAHEISLKRAAAGAAGGKAKRQADGKCEANASDLPQQEPSPVEPSIPSHPIPCPPSGEGGNKPVAAEAAAPTPAQPATQGPNRKRRGPLGHFVPDDWTVPEADYLWAIEAGYPPDFVKRETERFCDHEFKTPRSDWARAWRNWISRDPPKGGRNGQTYRAA